MRKHSRLRFFLNMIPDMLGWAALMLLLWGFVFLRLDDAAPAHKLVIYADCEVADPRGLMADLEDSFAEAADEEGSGSTDIRKIKLYSGSYISMGASPLEESDLFILSEAHLSELKERLLVLPEGRFEEDRYTEDCTSLLLGEGDSKMPLGSHLLYDAEQRYYLCFSKESMHAGPADESAFALAHIILNADK